MGVVVRGGLYEVRDALGRQLILWRMRLCLESR